MIIGARLLALIDIDRSSEFSGDDVDQYSGLVDLGREYEWVRIDLPAMTSSIVHLYLQEAAAVATVPKVLHYKLPADASTAAWGTTASAGSLSIVFPCAGARYIRVRATTNQTADRSIYVQGWRS